MVPPIIRNFVLGGFVVSSVSWIATYFNPLIAAIWWSFPLSLVPSLYFAHTKGKSNEYLSKFALSTTYALVLLFLSTYALSYFLGQSKDDVLTPVAKSAGVWFVGSIVFYSAVKFFKLDKKFM